MLTLTPDVADLYFLHDRFTGERLPSSFAALLAPDEAARWEALLVPTVRRQFLLARVFVRTVLSRYAEVSPAAWRFEQGPHGRPEIRAPSAGPALRFNLAHTTGMMALGIALDHDIGVDVEYTGRDVCVGRIARRFFAPSEAADVAARVGDDQRERFFAYWTLKESYIKARGLGLALPLGLFGFSPLAAAGEPVRIAIAPELNDDARRWQFFRYRPSTEHIAAVAVGGAQTPVHVRAEVVASPDAIEGLLADRNRPRA